MASSFSFLSWVRSVINSPPCRMYRSAKKDFVLGSFLLHFTLPLKSKCHIRRFKTDHWFTLKFVSIYAVSDHVLRLNPPDLEPEHDRSARRNLGHISCYEIDWWCTIKFVPIYAVWFTFYAEIWPSQNPCTVERDQFSRRNFWTPFAVTKQIYDLR